MKCTRVGQMKHIENRIVRAIHFFRFGCTLYKQNDHCGIMNDESEYHCKWLYMKEAL